MTKPLKTVLVGVGGYAASYGQALLDNKCEELQFTAIVDPYAKDSPLFDRFNGVVPVYNSLDEFFATGQKADLTIISTPIHLHYPQCIMALEAGSHVLCEKPLVPTIGELNRLDVKLLDTGLTLAVGFQWCYSSVMQALKARILAGEFGKPVSFKNLSNVPRMWPYYKRNSWAGRITTDDGLVVNDSVTSNATAHFIHNILFLLGSTMEDSAELTNAKAELYRANDIQAFDTCMLTGTAGGAKVFYAASHAVSDLTDIPMRYTFEKAEIIIDIYNFVSSDCIIHHSDGRVENLGNAMGDGEINKLIYTAQSIRGERPLACSARTVRPVTALIDALFSKCEMRNFSPEFIIHDNTRELTYVKGLHLDLIECYEKAMLPYEIGHKWAMEPSVL